MIDFIPFATEQKRGLSTRVSLSKALEQQGFKNVRYEQVESQKPKDEVIYQAVGKNKEVDVDYVIAKWNRRMENPEDNIKRLIE